MKNNDIKWDAFKKELLAENELRLLEQQTDLISQLIHARRDAELTQRELEEKSGLSKSTITRLETTETSPSLNTLLKYLGSLGKTIKVIDNE